MEQAFLLGIFVVHGDHIEAHLLEVILEVNDLFNTVTTQDVKRIVIYESESF